MAKSKFKYRKKENIPEPSDVYIPYDAYHIFTDGSVRPDGNAAYAYLIFSQRTKHIVKMERFACRDGKINGMELAAIDAALSNPMMDHVIIYTDSAYCISCLTTWYKTWQDNDWISNNGEPVKNKEVIQRILEKMKTKKFVRYKKCKAHTGDPFNTVVDYQAQDLTRLMRDDSSLKDGVYPVR